MSAESNPVIFWHFFGPFLLFYKHMGSVRTFWHFLAFFAIFVDFCENLRSKHNFGGHFGGYFPPPSVGFEWANSEGLFGTFLDTFFGPFWTFLTLLTLNPLIS